MVTVRTIVKLAAIAGKTVQFADVAQIREFCKSGDAREKFTALITYLCFFRKIFKCCWREHVTPPVGH